MSSGSFSLRFPWRLLNLLSHPRQKRWISKRVPSSKASIRIPPQRKEVRRRWIILGRDALGWPACGNALAHWPGETHLFIPANQSGIIHPGCALHLFDPELLRIGEESMQTFLLLAQNSPPDLVISLDPSPSLPLLHLIGQSAAPYRVGFGEEEHYPFLNISIRAKSPQEWGPLLTQWLEPI